MLIVPQRICPAEQQVAAPLKQGVAMAASLPPLLPLPPLEPESVPESVSAAGVVGLLLELQATANATAAEPETAHKIIEFFILETSLLSLCDVQAARVRGRTAVS
jgi:hypothetical protein